MKPLYKIKSLKKIFSIIYSVILVLQYLGCSPYATEDEIKNLETLKAETYLLEAEVKELKIRQLNLVKERAELIKKLNECQKFRDSLINLGVQSK
ncbi:MAG: hypothetical protein ACPL25_04320 [Ignavibacteria bacterium]